MDAPKLGLGAFMTDKGSFWRRARAPAAQPARDAPERPGARFGLVASGTPGAGLGMSVDMLLWCLVSALVVARLLLPDLDHTQWAVWGILAAGCVSFLNALRPGKK